jgi:gamma-glutamylcyclotransferase
MIETASGTSLYFAYGSNMCTGNLRQVALSATPIAVARLPRHELQFRKRSGPDDGAGSNPYETGRDESVVWGVVFRMTDADLQALIRLEDDRYGYVPTPKTVFPRGSSRHVTALVFMAKPGDLDSDLRPFDWYLRRVLEGAWQHDLPPDYIVRWIMGQEWVRDPDAQRRAQNIGLCC